MVSRWVSSLGRRLLLGVLQLTGLPVKTVWAHPHDELQQSVYVTPLPDRITIEVQMYPGLLVAEELASSLDLDGDGVISDSEAQAHIAALSSAISVSFDRATVPLRLVQFSYPPVALIRQSAAMIAIMFAADAPDAKREKQVTTVSYYHEPPNSTIQLNLTLSAKETMNVVSVERQDDGKTLTMEYSKPSP